MSVEIDEQQRKDAAQAVERAGGQPGSKPGFSSADPPAVPKGLSNTLQPGGVRPGGGPGASAGSIATGGGQNANESTGSLKQGGQ